MNKARYFSRYPRQLWLRVKSGGSELFRSSRSLFPAVRWLVSNHIPFAIRYSKKLGVNILIQKVPIDSMLVNHARLGPLQINKTPHFLFVQGLIDGINQSPAYLHYKGVTISDARSHTLLENFQALYLAYKDGATFEVSARLLPKSAHPFQVLDGFHRLAIIAAMGKEFHVRTRLVLDPKRNSSSISNYRRSLPVKANNRFANPNGQESRNPLSDLGFYNYDKPIV